MESNSAIFSSLVGIVPLNLGAMTIGDQGHHAQVIFVIRGISQSKT